MIRSVACAVFLTCGFLAGVNAEHFRGGYFRWEPTGRENEVKLHLRLAFKYMFFATPGTNEKGEDCDRSAKDNKTKLVMGKADSFLIIGKTDEHLYGDVPYYTCTDIHEELGWTSGYNESIIRLPARDPPVWNVQYQSCCWLKELLNYQKDTKYWRLRATIDLTPRDDLNGVANTSPYVEGLPMKTVSYRCGEALILLNAIDKDEDQVRCRWTKRNKGECKGKNCGSPNPVDVDIFEMIEDTCIIRVDPTEAVPGLYAVAVMIEDYPEDWIPGAGSSRPSPFSKIPYQFLVNIVDQNVECGRVVTEVPEPACYLVPPEFFPPFELTIRGYTTEPSIPIVAFSMQKKKGMELDALVNDGGGRYHQVLKWFISTDEIGKKEQLSFQAVDEDGVTGDEVHIVLWVGGAPPEVIPLDSTPSSNVSHLVETGNRKWILNFNERVTLRESSNRDVTFLYENGTVAHAVTISEDDGAEVGRRWPFFLSFETPEFLVANTTYTIRLDEGIVLGTARDCPLPSKPAEWEFRTMKFGKGNPKPPEELNPIDVECGPSSMTVYIKRLYFPDFNSSVMSFNDPSCYGSEVNDSHFKVVTKYGKCGTEAILNEDGTRVSMINDVFLPFLDSAVRTVYGDTLTRTGFERIRVNCSIPVSRVAYAEFSTEAENRSLQVDSVGDSNFTLKMFGDDSFSNPYRVWDYPARFQPSTTIYFEAKAFVRGFRPFLDECTASPTEDSSPSPHDYVLIQNGCPVDPTVAILKITKKSVRFSVVSFSFVGYNQHNPIFVYCQMRKCNPNDGSCDTDCPEPSFRLP